METRIMNGQITAVEKEGSDGRTVELSFSSEERVRRGWMGDEILDHRGDVDLSRLKEIGVLLSNHDPTEVLGRVDEVWLDGDRGKAIVTFDDDPEAERIFRKVRSGTLRGVSVGYQVLATEEVEAGARSTDGRFEGPCTVVRAWKPLEISIVAIPADASVGVGRSALLNENKKEVRDMNLKEMLERRDALQAHAAALNDAERAELELLERCISAAQEAAKGAGQRADFPPKDDEGEKEKPKDDEEEEKPEGRSLAPSYPGNVVGIGALQERDRQRQIRSMCEDLGVDCRQLIDTGASVDEARSFVLEQLRHKRQPLNAGVHVTGDANDRFRAAAVDGLLMRAGIQVDKPADGAVEFRGKKLRDLMIDAFVMDGESERQLRSMPDDQLMEMYSRAFFNPESAFPAILDQFIEKAYVDLYRHVPTTYERFTSKGSLPDFKKHDNYYQQGPVGEFQPVGENGELKHDVFSDAKRPQRWLETWGIQFTISRKAFIDDDIGLIASIPGRYARQAKKTINKQVYQALLGSEPIYDGAKLFCAAHNNLVGTGTGATQAAIQAMILALGRQVDDFGEPIDIEPRKLVVPRGMRFEIYTLFNSPYIETSDNTQAVNPLYDYRDRFDIIEDSQINILCGEDNPLPWFMLGDPADCPFIEVTYLNGQETPNMRRSEVSGQLGYIYDMWLDWRVNILDYRGAVKNPGIKLESKVPMATE